MGDIYVWSPQHKKHHWAKKKERYNTYLGVIVITKCMKCGDLKVEILKKKHLNVRHY